MGNISVSLPADGSTADVSDYNTPISTIVNEINGGLDNSNIKAGAAIDPTKLASSGFLGAWTAWTPTLSGRFNDSKWIKDCKYIKIGNTIHFKVYLKASTTTPMDGGTAGAIFSLPVNAATIDAEVVPIGHASILDAGTARAAGIVQYVSPTTARIRYLLPATTYTGDADLTSTAPFAYTTNDQLYCQGTYEAA